MVKQSLDKAVPLSVSCSLKLVGGYMSACRRPGEFE